MSDRTPTKITVQYRNLPHLPPQVLITRHYGRGVPRTFNVTARRPLDRYGDPVSCTEWADQVAKKITDGPVTVLPPEIYT